MVGGMKKIVSLFKRVDGQKHVSNIVDPDAQWVIDGEGVATRKWDGSACLVKDRVLYKRCEWRHDSGPPPANWFHWSFDPEQRSGHGWLKIGDGSEDRYHREACAGEVFPLPDGTYELCGPRVQRNPEGFDKHVLVRHGVELLPEFPREYDAIREALKDGAIEGVVWHHPDGRMAKVKGRDFGFGRAKPIQLAHFKATLPDPVDPDAVNRRQP
jgi:hypothetical protein